MNKRVSCVDKIGIIAIGRSSTFVIGDSVINTPKSDIMALQRDKAIFFEDELDPNNYCMFREVIPHPCVEENVKVTTINECPCIRVGEIKITSLVGSVVVQIGSSELVKSEVRAKNIRHLLREARE